MRTLASLVEQEGTRIQHELEHLTQQVLDQHQFQENAAPLEEMKNTFGLRSDQATVSSELIVAAIEQYNHDKTEDKFKIDVVATHQFYEDPKSTVNVSIDDVGVKKQKKEGRTPDRIKKETREYAHNTIAHIEKENGQYILNGTSNEQVLKILMAFLLHNQLLRGHGILFFVDGARNLHASILSFFQWLPGLRIILDWYHLEKKCEYELSLALKGSKIRNDILEKLLPFLWLGKIDAAIEFLQNMNPENFKSGQSIDRLVGYFERNRQYIPCYALRKQLGLRNSSNKGEKANDLCVATRQKHNGMSWSKDGSVALASVTAIHINEEQVIWRSSRKLQFKFAS